MSDCVNHLKKAAKPLLKFFFWWQKINMKPSVVLATMGNIDSGFRIFFLSIVH